MPRKGETGRIKATVTEHTDYKGEAQTLIARPKRLDTPCENWDYDNHCPMVEPEATGPARDSFEL